MKEENKTNTTYYFMEVPQQVYDLLLKGCKTLESLMRGDLEGVQQMAFEAYQRRTGIAVPPNMERQIKDCIKGLESWGWNRPVEHTSRFNDESDTYRDIADILDHQQAILGYENNSDGLPPHYNKDIPQIRIISAYENIKKRKKPLKLFIDKVSSKRIR